MRPRLERHSTVRHRPEHLSEGLWGCTEFLLKHYLPAIVQHAIPTPTIPQIQSHDVFLLRKVPGLLLCHSDTLPHSRSPFLLRSRARDHWELNASRLETGILIPSVFVRYQEPKLHGLSAASMSASLREHSYEKNCGDSPLYPK